MKCPISKQDAWKKTGYMIRDILAPKGTLGYYFLSGSISSTVRLVG